LSLLLLVLSLVLVVLFLVLPVKVAASIVGARRTGFGTCVGAIIVAVLINFVAGRLIHYGEFVSVLLTALAYMAVLDTTYLRGVVIAVLQLVFMWLFAILAAALGFAALLPVFAHGIAPVMHHHGSWV
jgi:hypothetical protein